MTSDAQKILEMIENVDPSDTEILDEIDARVWCWLPRHNCEFLEYDRGSFYCKPRAINLPFWKRVIPYTRSRDAMKSIRPKGWYFQVLPNGDDEWRCDKLQRGCPGDRGRYLPTEELAELHAIIQAIEWERNNGTPTEPQLNSPPPAE